VHTGLTGLYGIGAVGAATILGEVTDVRRYRSRHAFAAANGTAPLPADSGRTTRRHRLNRSGDRTLNRGLYTTAITQIRADTEGRAYYLCKRAEGKTNREAPALPQTTTLRLGLPNPARRPRRPPACRDRLGR
jgi:transposase